jgi:acyl-CoA thioesterase YciA
MINIINYGINMINYGINTRFNKMLSPLNQIYYLTINRPNITDCTVNVPNITDCTVDITQNNLILKALALHKEQSSTGIISGGWLMKQMDLAGGIHAWDITKGRVYTVTCDKLQFHKSVSAGDLVSFYAKLTESKKSSIKIYVEAIVRQPPNIKSYKVTTGMFTYVAVDKDGIPRNYNKKVIP